MRDRPGGELLQFAHIFHVHLSSHVSVANRIENFQRDFLCGGKAKSSHITWLTDLRFICQLLIYIYKGICMAKIS
jgi:hypothetical protein